MNTTFVYVELIVIGIQVLALILSAAFATFGNVIIDNIGKVKFDLYIFILMLIISYPLGIMFDKFSDVITKGYKDLIKCRNKGKGSTFKTYYESNYMSFYEYLKTRIRIIRSTMFLVPAICTMIIIGVLRFQTFMNKSIDVCIFVLLTASIFAAMSFISYRSLLKTYYGRAKQIRKWNGKNDK